MVSRRSKIPRHGNVEVILFPEVKVAVFVVKRDDGAKFAFSMSYEEARNLAEYIKIVIGVG